MRRFLLGLVVAVATLVPNLATANDQEIARQIMSKLQLEQQRGALKGFHVDMRVDQGTVWYEGFVANQAQKDLILRTAQEAQSLGVVQVVDDITVRSQASAPQAMPLAQASYTQEYTTPRAPSMAPRSVVPQQAYPQQMSGMPVQNAVSGGAPMPMARSASAPMPTSGDSANLPGYAWPSYAANGNYGQVSYPRQYSAAAWPYIGPFYPYPQVPLGWRKVTMEWDDGWWWLDFHNRR